MSTTVILNPYANRWKARECKPEIESNFRRAGIDFVIQETEYSGHGIELARAAAEAGNTPLIAVGGDGTITEVVNGLLQATPPENYPAGPVGFLPVGTANDLTDVLEIPRDMNKAMQLIIDGQTRVIDIGTVNGHYFDNNSAIGLEPMVSLENIRLTWLKGVVRYLTAAVLTILKKKSWHAQLKWDDGEYEGSLSLVSVGNTHRTGGVFYMTPSAKIDDGFLDFIYAPALSRIRLFQLLPKTQTGAHINEPEVKEHRTRRLTIRTNTPTPIQADGEVISTNATEITYEILPRALCVFSPTEKILKI